MHWKWLFAGMLFCPSLFGDLKFSAAPWELTVSEKNGAWLSLKYKGEELLANPRREQTLNLNAAVLKTAEGFADQSAGEAAGVAVLETALSEGEKESAVRLLSHRFDPPSKTLTLNCRSGNWMLTEEIVFGSDGRTNRIRRKGSFSSAAKTETKFRNFRFTLFFPLKGEYFFPATFFTDRWWREDNRPEYPEMRWENRSGKIAELSGSGNDRIKFSILSPRPELSLILFADSRLDGANVRYRRNRDNLQADWRFGAQGWAQPGAVQQLAGAYLEVAEKSAERALRENCPQMLKDLGYVPPADRAEWVRDAAIYGLSNEPFHLSRIADIPLCVLPRMKRLGLNTTWYRPSEASSCRYNPIDYKVIEPKIGSWNDYRFANETLHRNGIRVLQDLVPHGGGQVGFLLRGQSATMMAFTEEGNVLDGWAADFNNPAWRKYMGDVCEFYTGSLKTDGFRIDAIYGSKTLRNWRKRGFPAELPGIANFNNQSRPYKKMLPALWRQTMKLEGGKLPALEYDRASLASSCGGINMSNAMRSGARRGNPESAVLLESGELPFTACGDMYYDRDIQSCWFKLRALSPADFVKGLTLWLDEQQYVDAPGSIRMRYMETGVGESWPYRKWFGFEGDKAIRAMCAYIHGIPMVYETFTEGEGVFLNRVLKLRRELEPLRRGTADYLAVKSSDPAVFTVLRSTAEESIVAAINFSPRSVDTVLSLPEPLSRKAKLFELYEGKEIVMDRPGKLRLTLPPFGNAVIAALPELPVWAKQVRPAFAVDGRSAGAPSVAETDREIRISAGRYDLVIDRVSGLIRSFRGGKDGVGAESELFVRGNPADGKASVKIVPHPGGVTVRVRKADWELVYQAERDGVGIRAKSGRVRTFALSFPGAKQWELDSFEGMLADWLPENPHPRRCSILPFDGKQRGMMDHTLVWASSERPWDWNRPELRVFGMTDGITVGMRSGNGSQYLYQALENKTGLHYLAEFGGVEGELKLMLTPSAVHRESVFGRPVRIGKTLTLTNESYGWKVENSHYVMYILRSNGVIRELYAKVDGHLVPVLRKQNLTAAKTMFSGMPYAAASMDPETTVRLVRENGVLRMKFTGEIRSAYAVGKDRLRLVTEYVFDDSPQVGCEFTFRPSGARPGKPELVFSAERERFPKYLRWNMASSAGAGAVADVSRGRKLKFRFFDGIRNPLPPRTDYRIALSFRTDGKPCPRPRVPETAAPVILRADSGFEERCALVSEKDGRRILNLRSEYDETLPWFICFAAYAAPGIGRGGSAGIYMSWPNPVFMQEVNPGRLEQGRFRFSFDLKGTLLREPSVKAWSDRMITVHPFLKEYTPLSAHVDYYAENGVKKTLSRSWKLGKIYDWKTFEMTVDIPENAYAPSVRIEAMPEYAGVLFLDNISFEKVE